MTTMSATSSSKRFPRYICKWEDEQNRYVVRLHYGDPSDAHMYPAPVFMSRSLTAANNWIDATVTRRMEEEEDSYARQRAAWRR